MMRTTITFLILFSMQLCAGIGGSKANGTLPVELTSFRANLNGKIVELNWATATEVNNFGFEVQKTEFAFGEGSQSAEWVTIGFVKGNGNCNSPKEYSFTDPLNHSLKLSYRLKQIDNNGAFKYTKAIEVGAGFYNYTLWQNYPNPFNPTTIIGYQLPVDSKVVLTLYDIIGNEMAVLIDEYKQAGYYNYQLSIRQLTDYQLSSGIYYYKIQAGDFIQTRKMLLLK